MLRLEIRGKLQAPKMVLSTIDKTKGGPRWVITARKASYMLEHLMTTLRCQTISREDCVLDDGKQRTEEGRCAWKCINSDLFSGRNTREQLLRSKLRKIRPKCLEQRMMPMSSRRPWSYLSGRWRQRCIELRSFPSYVLTPSKFGGVHRPRAASTPRPHHPIHKTLRDYTLAFPDIVRCSREDDIVRPPWRHGEHGRNVHVWFKTRRVLNYVT